MKLKLFSSSLHLFLLISVFISDGIYTVYSSRNLLRTTEKVSCPMNFQFMNYTIITSRCKVFISDGIYTVYSSRNLLRTTEKFSCPMNFQFMNYTIITSRCKGPHFQHIECCDAFKEFACLYIN
ncbi:BnaCnng45450D [Brassica napus]|uniref:BnaCnng45450D protein n=1 Tax=Brassica napus TaxID=3708 RepID=A0A078JDX2_BRANA|nr:BnaCnng45450D [Brassica napus]